MTSSAAASRFRTRIPYSKVVARLFLPQAPLNRSKEAIQRRVSDLAPRTRRAAHRDQAHRHAERNQRESGVCGEPLKAMIQNEDRCPLPFGHASSPTGVLSIGLS